MKNSKIIFTTLFAFGVYFGLDDLYFGTVRNGIDQVVNQRGTSHNLAYLLSGIPLYLGLLIMHRPQDFFKVLGLSGPLGRAVRFAFLCTLPMVLGYAILFSPSREVTLNGLLISGLAAAFFEEVFYRGFLFGQLYRYTRLGFIPAVALGALLFAAIHLYQSQDLWISLGVFATTFLGAVVFAWTYAEWDHNIWVPVMLHLFMNLAWMLFAVSDNALGGVYANVFRIVTIGAIIGLTLFYKRRRNIPLEVTRHTLWLKPGQPVGYTP
ncbi:CPBP family intramembrane glutamic endopeptidase [Robiginitalea biformata]|uniref:CAAX prenyl protease 2/Lysostaphin resistance protein A-like domain-containing protein n=1 Tax=Robiginitalea biformata (strain ATCC BAA-864 / DSM 15991 / KCTC 12146 / HTCC2501) TaxID=313596 RepID=A4CGU1_ROBBH|nr:CPBP family intramembrane glutamic endopeptidase [Robiginitalea biformata]EAR16149.1 hypothetical protein RB2501_04605 [Robiginitalea biformata HTCC2501]